ncbi:MAG: methyltransferase domain-containing protein [Bdellovibrionales bacterium]
MKLNFRAVFIFIICWTILGMSQNEIWAAGKRCGIIAAELHPERTQMSISSPSASTKALVQILNEKGCSGCKVLDYGAGNGRNSLYLDQNGLQVTSYEPFPNKSPIFPTTTKINRKTKYEAILSSFVFNVLPRLARQTLAKEIDQLQWSMLLIEARAPGEIDAAAKKGKWKKHENGYLSSVTKQTFQVGLTPEDLLALPIRHKSIEVVDALLNRTFVIFHR